MTETNRKLDRWIRALRDDSVKSGKGRRAESIQSERQRIRPEKNKTKQKKHGQNRGNLRDADKTSGMRFFEVSDAEENEEGLEGGVRINGQNFPSLAKAANLEIQETKPQSGCITPPHPKKFRDIKIKLLKTKAVEESGRRETDGAEVTCWRSTRCGRALGRGARARGRWGGGAGCGERAAGLSFAKIK